MISSDSVLAVYKAVCAEYGIIPDENGIDAITRFDQERQDHSLSTPNLTKAQERFLYHDCAFISAERSAENGGTPELNEKNTKDLRRMLNSLKDRKIIDFFESDGWYQEIGSSQLTNEKGFFCIDIWPNYATNFFMDIHSFARMFNQDSFLYKSAGNGLTRTGYFIATNDKTMTKYPKGYWSAGELYYGFPSQDYTESKDAFGEKRVFFRERKPSLEELLGI